MTAHPPPTRPLPAVLVAGASGALGRAVVATLLEAGHPVTATYRRHPPADDEPTRDPSQLTHVRVDLGDPAEAAAAVAAVPDLGAVVNLVGGYVGGTPVHDTSPDAFDHMLRLNLWPTFLLARAAAPVLVARGGGAFVATSARAALRPFAGAAAYITAKAAALALVQALDVEYRNQGLRANAILPGVIDTPANRISQPGADASKWTAPEAIAEVVRFLVSEESTAVTGAAIPV